MYYKTYFHDLNLSKFTEDSFPGPNYIFINVSHRVKKNVHSVLECIVPYI